MRRRCPCWPNYYPAFSYLSWRQRWRAYCAVCGRRIAFPRNRRFLNNGLKWRLRRAAGADQLAAAPTKGKAHAWARMEHAQNALHEEMRAALAAGRMLASEGGAQEDET